MFLTDICHWRQTWCPLLWDSFWFSCLNFCWSFAWSLLWATVFQSCDLFCYSLQCPSGCWPVFLFTYTQQSDRDECKTFSQNQQIRINDLKLVFELHQLSNVESGFCMRLWHVILKYYSFIYCMNKNDLVLQILIHKVIKIKKKGNLVLHCSHTNS